jgi:multidrug efflux pump subunit AcrA (membrane-fusion protein)
MHKSLVVLLCLMLFLGSCGRKTELKQQAVAPEKIIPVKVSTVQEMQIAQITEITGEIQANYQVEIFPKINGLVILETTGLGQPVRQGDVLAELEQDIPGMDYAPVKIEATTAGTITRDEVEVGARVSPQRAVYTISQLNPILFIAKAPESLLGQIQTGAGVVVRLDAISAEVFRGRISEISPVVDPMTRAATLKITLSNPQLRFKPGMFGRVEIQPGEHTGLTVPIDALVRSGANQYIFLIKNNKAWRVRVETGTAQANQIEVRGELQAGDPVVVLGQNLLEEDTRVKIVTDF